MATALFLLDTALDAVMLLMAARFAGERIRVFRLLAGALLGAAAAQIVRSMAFSRAQTAALWLPTAMWLSWIAFGRGERLLRHAMLLLCAAGLLGGTVSALWGAAGSLPAAYALGALGVGCMTAALMRARRSTLGVLRVRIACRYRGRTAKFEAMIDSGNTLRDYLTHDPVIVMPETMGRRLFGIRDDVLRPIFADTAGGRQRMSLFVPQETVLQLPDGDKRVRAAVALSGALDARAPALAPASLMED